MPYTFTAPLKEPRGTNNWAMYSPNTTTHTLSITLTLAAIFCYWGNNGAVCKSLPTNWEDAIFKMLNRSGPYFKKPLTILFYCFSLLNIKMLFMLCCLQTERRKATELTQSGGIEMAPGEAEEEEAGGGKDTSEQPRLPASPPALSPKLHHTTADCWADKTVSTQHAATPQTLRLTTVVRWTTDFMLLLYVFWKTP